jgi:hypothetical protein
MNGDGVLLLNESAKHYCLAPHPMAVLGHKRMYNKHEPACWVLGASLGGKWRDCGTACCTWLISNDCTDGALSMLPRHRALEPGLYGGGLNATHRTDYLTLWPRAHWARGLLPINGCRQHQRLKWAKPPDTAD